MVLKNRVEFVAPCELAYGQAFYGQIIALQYIALQQ